MAQKPAPLIFPNRPRNLIIGDELNRGAWGTVYNGDVEGRPVAVKRIHELLHQGGGEDERRKLFEDFREECKKLQSLSHPHVVGFIGAFNDPRLGPILVMEKMQENLRQFLDKWKKKLQLPKQLRISLEIIQGVAFLHQQTPPLVHCDLNDKNVMFSFEGVVKIGDFGQSKLKKDLYLTSGQPGMVIFMPPEALDVDKSKYSESLDIFSVGVLMLEIGTQQVPLVNLCGIGVIREVERRERDLKVLGEDHPLRQPVLLCLKDNPKERPKASDLQRDVLAMVTANELRSQITSLQAALERAREEIAAKTEHEAKLTSQFQVTTNELRSQITSLQAALERAREEIAARTEHEAKLTSQFQVTTNELRSRITSLQAALERAREETAARTEHEAKLTSQFQADVASRDDNIRQLEEKCEQLEAQVHLEQYARSTDNRIALQYFLEMHRRRDMGHLTGFGLQMSSYSTPFQSGFDSQDFADMQMAGFHPGLGAGIQTMTLHHGLHGDRSMGMGPASSYRQGLSAPLSVPRNTASISRDPAPVKPKAKSAEAPSPPNVKDGLTTTVRPPQKDSKFAGGDPMVPKKTLHAEGSNSVCAEASAPTTSEPSQSQAREPRLPQPSNDSGVDSTGQKTYRKTKRRSHMEDVPTSEDDTNASIKYPPKGWKKKGDDSGDGDSDPESTADELWSDSESLSSVSTISQSMSKKTPDSARMKTALTYDGVGVRSPKSVLQESGEILTSVESRSSVVQGPTAKVPSVPPLVKQECSADPPSNRMPLAHAESSDDKVTLAEVHSPVPPVKTSGLGTEELPILTEDECPPLYAPDTGSALKLDPSSDDHTSLLGSFKPQHESAAVEVFEKDVTVRKSDENVKSDNHVSTTDENATRTDTASKTDENVSASDLTSVASVNEIQRHSLESTPVSHEPETTMQQSSMRCVRVPLRPPDHIAQMLVKDSPDECIDHRRSKHRLLLSMICSSIKQRWSMLARRLGLQENDVEDIKKNCDTSEGRGMAVVMKWVEQSKDRTGSGNDSSPATWHQLAICLAFIRRVDLVHLIRSRLLATEPAEKEALSSSDIIDITSPHNLCILRHVAVSIAERWSILAKHLRVNRDSVGPCDAYNDSTSMCFAVLMLWLSEQQGKDGTTFEMLFAHLRNMDCDHLVGEALLIGASECTC